MSHLRNKAYQDIYQTYENMFDTFDDSYKVHLATRLQRITGEEKFINFIRNYLEKHQHTAFTSIKETITNSHSFSSIEEPIRGTIIRNPVEYQRILRRKKYYRTHPKLKSYFDSISNLFLYFEYSVRDNQELTQILTSYREYDWLNNFIKKEHLIVHPVLFVNSCYQLFEMGCLNNLNFLHQWVKEVFPAQKVKDHLELFDQVYTYTHIIINESHFYQTFLSLEQRKKTEWILNFFSTYFEEIKTKLNIDLVVEILLCFMLCEQKNAVLEASALEYLSAFYDQKQKYLKKDQDATIQDMEHANALYLIYLKEPTVFFKAKENV